MEKPQRENVISRAPPAPAQPSPTQLMISSEPPGKRGGLAASEMPPYSVFSPATRTFLTYFLGVVMTLSTLTATIYFPLIPLLSTQLHVSVQAVNLTVTVYAVAQAVSPALLASLADYYGRRPVLLVLVAVYAAASLGLALGGSDSYPALLALRAVQSAGGSPLTAVAYGVAADVAAPAERGSLLGPMLSTCNGLSAAGPVVGGALALGTGGVRWVFVALLVVATLCLAVAGFSLPETARRVVGNGSRPARGIWRTWWTLLGRRSKRRAGGRPDEEARQKFETETEGRKDSWNLGAALGSFRILFYPDAAAVLWMVASSYTVYYTFQVAIPVIFDEVYGYDELQIGLVFLPGLAGMTIGGIIAGKLVDRNYAATTKDCLLRGPDDFPIEAARYRNCLGFVAVETALVAGYGWAVQTRAHPAVPIVLQFFACGCSTLLSHTASALLVDLFPDRSSAAYAAGQAARCGLSAASAAALQPLVDAVGRGWYFSMFGLAIGLSGATSVVVSRRWGMRWRQERQGRKD